MRFRRLVAGAWCLMGTTAIAVSCVPAPFDPCPEKEGFQDRGQMEWKWILADVNGGDLPVNHPNPAKNESLESLHLFFDTDRVNPPTCDSRAESSSGLVTAKAFIRKNGTLETKRFVGRFTHNHRTNTTTLAYMGYELNVTRNGTVIMATSKNVITPSDEEKLLFVFLPTYNLRFIRAIGPTEYP